MKTKNVEKLKKEVAEHVAADKVIQGEYWEGGKGCFIGCLAHANNPELIEKEYGIPVMLTRVCESVFEGLASDDAVQFFADFPAAVGDDGKDLTLVAWQFLAAELRAMPDAGDAQKAVDGVIAGMDILASGGEWDVEDARAAADAAYAAYAARAAARDANAAYAAYAANAAAYAAVHAAASAAHAANAAASAANVDVRLRQRDTLLKLISDAEVTP